MFLIQYLSGDNRMSIPAHKGDTKGFSELTFAEQAKSITASINNLQSALVHHVQHAPNPKAARKKCLRQIHRLAGRLLERMLLVVLMLSIITGCDKSNETSSATADPVAGFKSFSKKLIPRLKSSYAGGDGHIIKAATFSDDFSIDVQKTNSLVSPYRGLLIVAARYQTSDVGGQTNKSVFDNMHEKGMETLIFALQDGKWVYQDHRFSGRLYSGDSDHPTDNGSTDSSELSPEPIEKAVEAVYNEK
jgi:hypothetical protein